MCVFARALACVHLPCVCVLVCVRARVHASPLRRPAAPTPAPCPAPTPRPPLAGTCGRTAPAATAAYVPVLSMAPELLQTLKALSKSTIFENHQEQSLGRENISEVGHQCPAAFVSHYPQFILPIHKNKDCFKRIKTDYS